MAGVATGSIALRAHADDRVRVVGGVIVLVMLALTLVNIGISCAKPPLWSMPTLFLSGSAAAAGIATINSIGNLGGFVGPSMIGWIKQPGRGAARRCDRAAMDVADEDAGRALRSAEDKRAGRFEPATALGGLGERRSRSHPRPDARHAARAPRRLRKAGVMPS
jgi:hypothetical protein